MKLDDSKVQSLIDKYKITFSGTEYKSKLFNSDTRYTLNTYDKKRFIELLDIIPIFYKKSSRKGKSSYNIKHVLEPLVEYGYINNGLAILAFGYLDYELKFFREPSPNINILASFEIDFKLLIQYIRKLKSEITSEVNT